MGGKPKPKVFLLLVRSLNPVPHWVEWSQHDSEPKAEQRYRSTIRGRGITAWVWWGPEKIAKRMLKDPDYEPKGKL